MTLAVMQPYIFPYIGYFQLINAVNTFVFYDDVNFIKNGWINRNRILLNSKDHYITIPCLKVSSFKLINEVNFDQNNKEFKKLLKTIEQAYKRAPYFDEVFSLVESVLDNPTNKISELAERSVIEICQYLGIKTQFKVSSVAFPETKGMEKADRLISICKKEKAAYYINPIGGMELYEKSYFKKDEIQLSFIKSLPMKYDQFGNEFVPWLSIIDVLMFNTPEEIQELLLKFELI